LQIDALGLKAGVFFWQPVVNETLDADSLLVPISDAEK